MAKKDKELLSQLTSEGAKGPFVTIMLNTHVAHQDVEKIRSNSKILRKKQRNVLKNIPNMTGPVPRKN